MELQENADRQIRGLGLGLGLRGKCGSADPHILAVLAVRTANALGLGLGIGTQPCNAF